MLGRGIPRGGQNHVIVVPGQQYLGDIQYRVGAVVARVTTGEALASPGTCIIHFDAKTDELEWEGVAPLGLNPLPLKKDFGFGVGNERTAVYHNARLVDGIETDLHEALISIRLEVHSNTNEPQAR